MAEIEVKGKNETIIKVKTAGLGGLVLAIYTGEGEVSAPAIWLENDEAVAALTEAIANAHSAEG